MIIMKLALTGLLGLAGVSALAAAPLSPNSDQTGLAAAGTRPAVRSNNASNIVPSDSQWNSAPTLPSPAPGLDAPSRKYLRAARTSLTAGHTGEAEQSPEMVETRILGESDTPDSAKQPTANVNVSQIRSALHVLGSGDRAHAIRIIDIVLAD